MYPYPLWGTDFPSVTNNFCGNYNSGANSPMFSACGSPSVSVNYNSPYLLQSSPPHPLLWIFKLNKRITTCYGCRNKFTRSADGGLPIPPLDLILKCNEVRQYYNKAGVLQEKDNSNTYYHPDINCIKSNHPDIQCSDVRLDGSV